MPFDITKKGLIFSLDLSIYFIIVLSMWFIGFLILSQTLIGHNEMLTAFNEKQKLIFTADFVIKRYGQDSIAKLSHNNNLFVEVYPTETTALKEHNCKPEGLITERLLYDKKSAKLLRIGFCE